MVPHILRHILTLKKSNINKYTPITHSRFSRLFYESIQQEVITIQHYQPPPHKIISPLFEFSEPKKNYTYLRNIVSIMSRIIALKAWWPTVKTLRNQKYRGISKNANSEYFIRKFEWLYFQLFVYVLALATENGILHFSKTPCPATVFSI